MKGSIDDIVKAIAIGLAATLYSGIGYAQGNNRNPTAYVTPSNTVAPTSNGQTFYVPPGSPIGVVGGVPTVRSIPEQISHTPYQQPTIDEQIQQNPEQARLYIQKADALIQERASPQEIIKTLETALKQKKLEGTKREKAIIYNGLSAQYNQINNNKKAYEMALKKKEIDPTYPYVDASINEYKKILNIK